MPVESATYISDLNASNPIGATDPLSSADDHLRLTKSTIKATFPAITGAVTASHTELNNLAGVTGKTGTGNVVLSASPTLTGTLTAAAITASGTVAGSLFSGSGASLTNLPAANLTGALPAISGASLTSLNATNIASGTLADARLSANVPLLNASNVFTAANAMSAAVDANVFTEWRLTGTGARGYVGSRAGVSGAGTGFGVRSETSLAFDTGGANERLVIDVNGNFDFKAGTVTRNNASASEVGYAGSPRRDISSSDNTAATDAGKTIRYTAGSGSTFTLDGDPPTDSRVTLINVSGGNITLACSGTLTHPNLGTGSRTLAAGSACELHHLGSGSYYFVSGIGTIT